MKHILSFSAALLLTAVFVSHPVSAQTELTGNTLNVYRDTANTVMPNSGSAAFGRNNTVPVSFSYAFGERNVIGQYAVGSFALGALDTLSGSHAVSIGSYNTVSSQCGMAFGRYLYSTGTFRTFVIGEGLGTDARLGTNASNCLLVGFLSTKPTLMVTGSPNNYSQGILDKTGKVGIGDVTPTAKLHIKSDVGEDAALILEPKQPTISSTYIRMRDANHRISVSNTGVLQVTAGNNNLNLTGANFSVSGSRMDLGTTSERRLVLAMQDTPALYCNASYSHGMYTRYAQGPSYAMRFETDGLLLRTAENQLPTGSEITNWRDAVYVGIDGTITLNGKVGVNTENTSSDYALAVDGGILTTKVYVKEVDGWPDYVFDPGYERMPLYELERYVSEHGHLPDVPSAGKAETCGYDLGSMQAALLRKVEELTLYTLDQQKTIDALLEQNKRQQLQIDALLSGDTVRFTYDACGNRTGRTVEFSRMDEGGGKGGGDPKKSEEWFAELHDNLIGGEASLFPNPTDGVFTLALTGDIAAGAKASLLTLTGAVVMEQTVTGTSTEFDLNVHPAGVYLLRLTTDRETRTWKVVKRN